MSLSTEPDTQPKVPPETPTSSQTLPLRLLAIAEEVSDASLLLKAGFQLRHPALYKEALKAFGSWEAVLAEMVVIIRDKEQILNPVEVLPAQTELTPALQFHREVNEDSQHPLFVTTTTGELLCIPGDHIPVTSDPNECLFDEPYEQIKHIQFEGSMNDICIFTSSGLYFGVIHDFVPKLDNIENMASLLRRLDIPEGDRIIGMTSRRKIEQNHHRLIHVTRRGKGKATSLKDYALLYRKQGKETFLLKEDDEPITILLGKEFNGLFCASAMGQGIHMDAQDLRTMGRKSVGVNVMKLSGADDAVVSAFLTRDVEQLVLITAQGHGKRVNFHEFRKQGRGGSGMQLLRLNPHDTIVGVQPIHRDEDVLISTNQGRVWRMSPEQFPEMGRAARGKRILETEEGEVIIGLSILPCGGNPRPEQIEEDILTEQETSPII